MSVANIETKYRSPCDLSGPWLLHYDSDSAPFFTTYRLDDGACNESQVRPDGIPGVRSNRSNKRTCVYLSLSMVLTLYQQWCYRHLRSLSLAKHCNNSSVKGV